MDLVRDVVGCAVFFDEEDDPVAGTLHLEYTDKASDEFGIFIRAKDRDVNIYVTFELWKKLYEMAMHEIELHPRYSKHSSEL